MVRWLDGLCQKSLISLCNLCVLCASVVKELFVKTTTETQRTQRLHREIRLFWRNTCRAKNVGYRLKTLALIMASAPHAIGE